MQTNLANIQNKPPTLNRYQYASNASLVSNRKRCETKIMALQELDFSIDFFYTAEVVLIC
jgi:hypothetical protein